MNITLRAEKPTDEPFIRNLILETIALELGASDWPEPMRGHLLGVQYRSRRHARSLRSDDRTSFVIQAHIAENEIDAGWLLLARMPHELRLVEIMVSPELRGNGIGSAAIQQLIQTASGSPVRLNAAIQNAGAIRLYERLGFRKTGGDDVQYFMEY